MNTAYTLIFIAFFATTLQAQGIQVDRVHNSVFDCFAAGAKDGNTLCYCETSAVVFCGDPKTGGTIYVASDKNTPQGSPLFRTSIAAESPIIADLGFSRWAIKTNDLGYVRTAPINKAKKYEDFALTPDRTWVLAITGFDRVDAQSAKMDEYNMLLAWQPNSEDKAQIIGSTDNSGVVSSVGIRQSIEKALNSHFNRSATPYYKIEGLAVLPKNRILFGVREMGNSYSDFEYKITFIQVTYTLENNTFALLDDWKVVYDFSSSPQDIQGITTPLGLSSIEYDPFGKRLYVVTSYELPEKGAGAYIWVLTEKDMLKQSAPKLVYKGSTPLHFRHKAEDITPLAKNEALIIHDDDRVLHFGGDDSRLPHQAMYSVLRFSSKK